LDNISNDVEISVVNSAVYVRVICERIKHICRKLLCHSRNLRLSLAAPSLLNTYLLRGRDAK